MNTFVKDKVRVTVANLLEQAKQSTFAVPELLYMECGYKSKTSIPSVDDTWKKFGRNDRVGGVDKHFWFNAKFKAPRCLPNQQAVFEITTGKEGEWDATNPQGILYLNGKLIHGLDINHRQADLESSKDYEMMLYFYTGMHDSLVDVKINVSVMNTDILGLYYDMQVAFDAAVCFEEKEYAYIKTMKHLEHACNLIDFRSVYSEEYFASIESARKYLKEEYYEKVCGASDAVVSCVGHTHIDVAWLWTLEQTREKTIRSFSTVLDLMDKYPEYIFMSSQPQLYEYLKEEEPELYEKLKERAKEGRWEVEGAMWLEADCNLSSGESLIRQVMHGKAFMKEEFGVDSHILWLPDVFGYSAALPQILKKSGVDKFVTSKISWNETNTLPYDSFIWEGVDGTEIFTYFMTAQNHDENTNQVTYIGHITPSMVLGTWNRYQQKEYNNETLITFGYGDGGGGPTAEMLEMQKRMAYGLPGMPRTQISRAEDFLERVEDRFLEGCRFNGKTPRWVGELYLELHRATYTSVARNKKNNRMSEFLCQTTEWLSVADMILNGQPYPSDVMHKNWRKILLNQFHDIIPGSSIKEVYEECDRQYAKLFEEVGAVKCKAVEDIASNVSSKGLLVYNPNSFEASGYVQADEELVYVENIPALGYRVVEEASPVRKVQVSERRIETDNYLIIFDENMNITSLFDKDYNREVVKNGTTANQFRVFEDYPRLYDNWEVTDYYKQKMWEVNDVNRVKIIEGNGFGGFEIIRKTMNSTITQKILVYSESRRIDFRTEIDWHENHVILKVAFPTTIHTNKANYEIQFGNVERPNHSNTSWDAAKFEVCAQKWGDLSDENYGVSVLNDCKYGYSADGGEMSLTLIKCGTDPNPVSDEGYHSFTYSLYPHEGNARRGGTIKEAYLLNRPLEAVYTEGGGKLDDKFSLVSTDCDNIIIETVKKAESGDGIVVRMYDACNMKTQPVLKFGFEAEKVYLCDLLENPVEEIGSGTEVKVDAGNFEIVTLLIKAKK